MGDAAESEEPVFQLVYMSAATCEFTEDELAALLQIARERNQKLGVTGMLLFHEGSFIQALEGRKEDVEMLYGKIGGDGRHAETQILYRGELPERDFSGWSMGFYRSAESAAQNLEGFHRFMASGFRNDSKTDGSVARKALLAFREGKWRQQVDT